MRKFVVLIVMSVGLFAVPATASALKFEAAPGTPLGAGSAQFDPPEVMPTGFSPTDVAAGHFNNDSYEDLAVVSDVSRYIYVYLGSADGSLTPSASNPIGANSDFINGRLVIHASDLDKDGDVDLATTGFSSPTLEVYLNNRIKGNVDFGNESFGTLPDSFSEAEPETAFVAGYTSTYFGDKDGDGDDDVVIGMSGNEYAYLQNNGGEFTTPYTSVPAGGPSPSTDGGIYSTTIGDFDGDGQGDLVMVTEPPYDPENPEPVSILFAKSSGATTFAPAVEVTSTTEGNFSNVRSVNLNGDQYDDLIFQEDSSEDGTGIALGSASGPVVQDPADSTIDIPFRGGPSFGDYNKDGKADVALPMFNDQTFEVAFGDGKGNLFADPAGPFDMPDVGSVRFLPQRTASLDVNGDGQLDFAAISGHSGDESQGRGVAVMLGELLGTRLSVKVKSAKRVKAGKKLLVTTTVRNTGDLASGEILLKTVAPKKKARNAKAMKVQTVGIGKSVVRKFRVPIKRNARGKLQVKITVRHAGKTITGKTSKVLIQKPR